MYSPEQEEGDNNDCDEKHWLAIEETDWKRNLIEFQNFV